MAFVMPGVAMRPVSPLPRPAGAYTSAAGAYGLGSVQMPQVSIGGSPVQAPHSPTMGSSLARAASANFLHSANRAHSPSISPGPHNRGRLVERSPSRERQFLEQQATAAAAGVWQHRAQSSHAMERSISPDYGGGSHGAARGPAVRASSPGAAPLSPDSFGPQRNYSSEMAMSRDGRGTPAGWASGVGRSPSRSSSQGIFNSGQQRVQPPPWASQVLQSPPTPGAVGMARSDRSLSPGQPMRSPHVLVPSDRSLRQAQAAVPQSLSAIAARATQSVSPRLGAVPRVRPSPRSLSPTLRTGSWGGGFAKPGSDRASQASTGLQPPSNDGSARFKSETSSSRWSAPTHAMRQPSRSDQQQQLQQQQLQQQQQQQTSIRGNSDGIARRTSDQSADTTTISVAQESTPPQRAGDASPSTAPVTVAVASAEELEEGCCLRIGDCTCQVSHALGMGSFGAVWAADRADGTQLAVKEIVCNSHSDLMNALFESHLLRILGSPQDADDSTIATGSSAQASCAGLVPALVASESLAVGVDTWKVRLVMTRVHGEPLDLFLEQHRKLHESMKDSCGGTGAVGWRGMTPLSQQFEEAYFFTKEMLAQLAPAFEHISSIAFHRDVNSHNILIDGANGLASPPRFGLVDFGLAVDSMCWCNEEGATPTISRPSRVGQDGSSTWHYLDVGGDCRYWPLSAWVQFLAGWRELAACPSLCFEYQGKLDLHALGITALQLLAELLPLPSDVANGVRSAEVLEGALEIGGHVLEDAPPELLVLRIVWERYWGRVSPLHARLISTFHTGGDWDALKVDCIKNGVHEKIAEDLRMLRAAIKEVREACRRQAEEIEKAGVSSSTSSVNLASCADLFDALMLLVSDGQSTEKTPAVQIWRGVQDVLGPSKAPQSINAFGASKATRELEMPALRPRKSSSSNGRQEVSRRSIGTARDNSRPRSRVNIKVRESTLTQSKSTGNLVTTSAPRPYRTSSPARSDEATVISTASRGPRRSTSQTDHLAPERSRSGQAQPENLSRRLHDLKSRVAWLSSEMAKLGEKSEVVGRQGSSQMVETVIVQRDGTYQ